MRSVRTWAVVATVLLALLPAPPARADTGFTARYAADVNGGVSRAANTVVTCMSAKYGKVPCPKAQAGATVENHPYWMTFVDADGDPATFSSSGAHLPVPKGSRIVYARLYWGGLLESSEDSPGLPPGNRFAPDAAARGTVRFKGPGASYATVTADPADIASSSLSGKPVYQASADVTALVAGPGTYWTADMQAARGNGFSACDGWTLVAVFAADASPPRAVTINDGFVRQAATAPPLDIHVNGFHTPRSGPVIGRVGLVAYEGDRGATGDGATVTTSRGVFPLSDAANPADDLFNSSIAAYGLDTRARRPDHRNTLGYDSDLIDVSGTLSNGDTEMTVSLFTHGDAYLPGVVFTEIDLDRPPPAQPASPASPGGSSSAAAAPDALPATGTRAGLALATGARASRAPRRGGRPRRGCGPPSCRSPRTGGCAPSRRSGAATWPRRGWCRRRRRP